MRRRRRHRAQAAGLRVRPPGGSAQPVPNRASKTPMLRPQAPRASQGAQLQLAAHQLEHRVQHYTSTTLALAQLYLVPSSRASKYKYNI